jgi:hypothetical protein
MQAKLLVLFLPVVICCLHKTYAQYKPVSFLNVTPSLKDSFWFTNQWDYPWYLIKDEAGRFSSNISNTVKPADTAHLYFTAKCRTSVQGGYNIRYCEAKKQGDIITLTFFDGEPSYISRFYVYIKQSSFYFKPQTIYPTYMLRSNMQYTINSERLSLVKNNYAKGDVIAGYIDCVFTETSDSANHPIQRSNLYIKGYFKTPVQ